MKGPMDHMAHSSLCTINLLLLVEETVTIWIMRGGVVGVYGNQVWGQTARVGIPELPVLTNLRVFYACDASDNSICFIDHVEDKSHGRQGGVSTVPGTQRVMTVSTAG